MIAVCSFIGHHDVYDVDLQFRMQETVDRLAAEHEAIEFLVYPGGRYSYVFLLAVLRARTQYPQKVTITFV